MGATATRGGKGTAGRAGRTIHGATEPESSAGEETLERRRPKSARERNTEKTELQAKVGRVFFAPGSYGTGVDCTTAAMCGPRTRGYV